MELTLGNAPGPCELMHHSSRGCLASSSIVSLGPENTSPPSPPQFQGLMSTEEAPDARLPGLQTTVGLWDWHSLKMESVHLNAPSEGRGGSEWGWWGLAGSTSPSLGVREKGYISGCPATTEHKGPAGFHLSENKLGQISGRISKVPLPREAV